MIREIWEIDPSTMYYFYTFPDEWEKNGLAQAVRDKFGVPVRIIQEADVESDEDDEDMEIEDGGD